MSFTEGILITIVIILTIVILTSNRGKTEKHTKEWDCVDRKTGEITNVKMQYQHRHGCKCPKCASPEKEALMEQAEYFTACNNTPEAQKLAHDMCGDDDKFSYAVNEFGAPGLEFKDWVLSNSVDMNVLRNHTEFVKDRLGDNSQNVTGRTWSPSFRQPEFEGVSDVPWQGLRRGENVKICNPTQVAEYNPNLYTDKPKFTWDSS